MNYFNFQRKLFWSDELVRLPERWIPPEDKPHTSGEPRGVGWGKAQDADTRITSSMDVLVHHLHGCQGVGTPPRGAWAARQRPWEEEVLAEAGTHVLLGAAGQERR